jgi:hypothetical protein
MCLLKRWYLTLVVSGVPVQGTVPQLWAVHVQSTARGDTVPAGGEPAELALHLPRGCSDAPNKACHFRYGLSTERLVTISLTRHPCPRGAAGVDLISAGRPSRGSVPHANSSRRPREGRTPSGLLRPTAPHFMAVTRRQGGHRCRPEEWGPRIAHTCHLLRCSAVHGYTANWCSSASLRKPLSSQTAHTSQDGSGSWRPTERFCYTYCLLLDLAGVAECRKPALAQSLQFGKNQQSSAFVSEKALLPVRVRA